MSQLMPYELMLKNLRQEIPPSHRREYLPPEKAYTLLKEWSGQDFGMDAERWQAWAKANNKL